MAKQPTKKELTDVEKKAQVINATKSYFKKMREDVYRRSIMNILEKQNRKAVPQAIKTVSINKMQEHLKMMVDLHNGAFPKAKIKVSDFYETK